MNYQQTLDYLFSRLPMFHRVGAAAYKPNLDNTLRICRELGSPEQQFRSIHVAGTNGKGSVSHLLASVLQEAGFKTGLYTSPHLKDFRERIRINGKMVPASFVTGFVAKNRELFEKIDPSFFEYTVGLAFQYFAMEKVDIAVLETGLGGRLDSTNVVTPLLSVITNISKDHTAFLGDTLDKIAMEKAGIIKYGVPVVIGERQDETDAIFIARAIETASSIYFAEDYIKMADHIQQDQQGRTLYTIFLDGNHSGTQMACPLEGRYQKKNLTTAIMAVELLKRLGFVIGDKDLSIGIERVVINTGLAGRWQVQGDQPKVILDVGHNEAGIREILGQLEQETYGKLHWVLGMVNDKDLTTILNMLPKEAEYYFCKANIPRGLDVETLREKAMSTGLKGNAFPSVRAAFESAKKAARKQDLVLVAGSTFTVAEVI